MAEGELTNELDSAYIDPELSAEEYPNLVWGKLYPRLQGLKARYDPGNVFRSPQSIKAR